MHVWDMTRSGMIVAWRTWRTQPVIQHDPLNETWLTKWVMSHVWTCVSYMNESCLMYEWVEWLLNECWMTVEVLNEWVMLHESFVYETHIHTCWRTVERLSEWVMLLESFIYETHIHKRDMTHSTQLTQWVIFMLEAANDLFTRHDSYNVGVIAHESFIYETRIIHETWLI